MELVLGEVGSDVGHEGGEVVLVVGEGTQHCLVFVDLDGLEVLQGSVCSLRRGEDDRPLSAFKSNLLPQLPLISEVILHTPKSTFSAISISSESSLPATTLMNNFLSVSSFSPTAYGLATLS